METKRDPAPLHAECSRYQCNHGQMTPTPTPWKHNGDLIRSLDDFYVAKTAAPTDEGAEANAAFIVRAVNCHEELVQALKDVIRDQGFMSDAQEALLVKAQAIAKAEGK